MKRGFSHFSPHMPQSAGSLIAKNEHRSDSSLALILTRECIKHLNETADQQQQEPPLRTEESTHPHPNSTKIKKMIRLEGAEKLLIVFDKQCDLSPKNSMLRFYKDVGMTELIASFTGMYGLLQAS